MFDFPSTGLVVGQTVTTPGGVVYRWDGVRWLPVANAFQGAVVIADTPPATPPVGELWFDSTGLQTYLRYNDGSSVQWIPVINQNAAPGEAPTTGAAYARQNSAWVPTSQSNVGRNLLHNGLFNVQQRGQGPWTVNGFTADRWQVWCGAGETISTSVVTLADADRTAIGDEAAAYCLQTVFTGGSAAANGVGGQQAIENVRRLANKTITISWWAVAASGTPKMGMGFEQYFGTGGSPSAAVLANGQSVTLSTTWARYSVTFAVPTITGKTLGTNNDHSTILNFWFSAGANNNAYSGNIGVQSGTIKTWGIQLEIGPVATTLEKLDPRLDLSNCQRFYCVMQQLIVGGAASASGWTFYGATIFPVQMRAAPTTTLANTVYGGGPNLSGFAVGATTPSACRYSAASTGATSAGYCITDILASADL